MIYTMLAYFLRLVSMMNFNCKAMPTNYVDCRCNTKVVVLV